MDKTKLKKLFYELKATTSDIIFSVFMFCMLYLLLHAIITDSREGDRIKGSSITVTSKGHEYIIFETNRGNTCCIHSVSCPCQVKKQNRAPVPSDSIAGLKKNNLK
nr:MAG TPA: NqrA, NqrB, NqrC, NqrD, NqrE Complex, NADH:ubiquinone oxidoreductase, Sodium [Caudoviricetes sp.]